MGATKRALRAVVAVTVAATIVIVRAATPGAAQAPDTSRFAEATFAGGCFWCMEHPFDHLAGVISVTSGYTGGHTPNPTYEEVSAGHTGHAESVRIVYDPKKIAYAALLEIYWHNVDPLTPDAQFCDQGTQYRTAVFYHNEEQRQLAEESKRELERSGRFKQPVVTAIVPASAFYPAEEYHQHYYQKNPVRYKFYRWNCGRDAPPSRLGRRGDPVSGTN